MLDEILTAKRWVPNDAICHVTYCSSVFVERFLASPIVPVCLYSLCRLTLCSREFENCFVVSRILSACLQCNFFCQQLFPLDFDAICSVACCSPGFVMRFFASRGVSVLVMRFVIGVFFKRTSIFLFACVFVAAIVALQWRVVIILCEICISLLIFFEKWTLCESSWIRAWPAILLSLICSPT